MKYINYIIIAVIFIIAFESCKKYLDAKSGNDIATATKLSDLQALLDDASIMNEGRTPSFGEAAADDYFLLKTTFDARNTNDQNLYRWIPFDYNWDNDWSRSYSPVYNANYCLELLEDIEVNNSNRQQYNNIRGSALFYRSYYFLQLLWTFSLAYDESTAGSDLGIVLKLETDFNVQSVRANVKDSYARVINDARESVALLPDLPQHPYRPSKASAYGLLARTYLSMRKYDSAFKYADLSLSLKNSLLDFKTDINAGSSAPFTQFNDETIFFTVMNRSTGLVVPQRGLIDTTLYATFAINDLRKKAYFQPSGNYFRFKGSYTGTTLMFTGIATDEMYLIRAEAYARAGDKDRAMAELNSLLQKRYDATFSPVTAGTVQEALQIILQERRKELYWRGIRFIDIKRLNKEDANISLMRKISDQAFSLPPNDKRYAIWLPKDIIDQSGMQQNP